MKFNIVAKIKLPVSNSYSKTDLSWSVHTVDKKMKELLNILLLYLRVVHESNQVYEIKI